MHYLSIHINNFCRKKYIWERKAENALCSDYTFVMFLGASNKVMLLYPNQNYTFQQYFRIIQMCDTGDTGNASKGIINNFKQQKEMNKGRY